MSEDSLIVGEETVHPESQNPAGYRDIHPCGCESRAKYRSGSWLRKVTRLSKMKERFLLDLVLVPGRFTSSFTSFLSVHTLVQTNGIMLQSLLVC